MPHQCVRCGVFYEDGSSKILKGCTCGGKLFFFVSKDKLQRARESTKDLSTKDKQKIEEEVYELIGEQHDQKHDPVVLDFESIRVMEPGKFELDLVHLFNKEHPLVYKISEGKYMIDLAKSFKKAHK